MYDSVAGNPDYQAHVERQVRAIRNRTPYHSLELPGGKTLEGIIPVERLKDRLNRYPIPEDLRGRRALDVGAASGWNSFALEQRGASVVALDCVEYPEFHYARRALNSNVEYVVLDVDEISRERLGVFDYVVCFGVLYHLRHPLLALEKICGLTLEQAFVESYVIDPAGTFPGCAMEFYETTELGGQIDNWWGPTVQCLAAMCRSAGFGGVDFLYAEDRRAGFVCRRRWPLTATVSSPPPLLCFAVNNRHQDRFFCAGKDEYICLSFHAAGELERVGVLVEIDGFAVPALVLASTGPGRWQVNTRVPPGLDPGRHDVRLRTADSDFSNTAGITVVREESEREYGPGSGEPPSAVKLIGAGAEPGEAVVGDLSIPLPVHFTCAGGEAEAVVVELDGAALPVLAMGFSDVGVHQANCRLPQDLEAGRHEVWVRTASGVRSNSGWVRVET